MGEKFGPASVGEWGIFMEGILAGMVCCCKGLDVTLWDVWEVLGRSGLAVYGYLGRDGRLASPLQGRRGEGVGEAFGGILSYTNREQG